MYAFQPSFLGAIASLLPLENFQPTTMLNGSKNTKRKGKDTWIIQPYNPSHKANGVANNLFGFAWPYPLAPGRRNQAMQFAKTKLTAYYANLTTPA